MIKSSYPAWLHSVHHDGSEEYISDANPRIGSEVKVRLRCESGAPIKEIYLRTFPDGEQALSSMKICKTIAPCTWWEVDLIINEPVVSYRFLIVTEDTIWSYGAAGPSSCIPLDRTDFRLLANQNYPDWVHSAVFYQIFPDRFADGDIENNPQPDEFDYQGYGPKTFPWGSEPDPDHPFPLIFYGGDLIGINQHLNHLHELGVNAIYLNPIFTANSNHKYDVTDYFNVDEHLGGNDALIQLRQALNEWEMRYVLDIVPNHCGYWHPWFQSARANEKSEEAEFFVFNDHPDDYVSWLGVWSLPKLNYKSRELRRRIYEDHDAVFRHWLLAPYEADGWRIDVANMLGRQGETQISAKVVQEIRMAVKGSKPDAYLMGENFFDGTPQLQGNQLDAIMNYTGFTLPLWYWLDTYREWAHNLGRHVTAHTAMSTEAMVATWITRMASVPWTITLQQLNILDSHDTSRLKSIVHGNKALQKLAIIVQFTFPGVPCIYYGDEIGMSDDPALQSRGCMIWDQQEWDLDLYQFYQALIMLRRQSPILQTGGFQILGVEKDTFVYLRHNSQGRIIVIGHRSPKPRPSGEMPVAHGGIRDNKRFREMFSGQILTVKNGSLLFPKLEQGATIWIEL
ncbi:MAG: alpha-amylase family glycosyl hydrolase [Candidatus Promineifilaceae bacterium]|nr:alpha-amylase family glycosyl hydrolase [Candidatus Promineifilaceae bacterium]